MDEVEKWKKRAETAEALVSEFRPLLEKMTDNVAVWLGVPWHSEWLKEARATLARTPVDMGEELARLRELEWCKDQNEILVFAALGSLGQHRGKNRVADIIADTLLERNNLRERLEELSLCSMDKGLVEALVEAGNTMRNSYAFYLMEKEVSLPKSIPAWDTAVKNLK